MRRIITVILAVLCMAAWLVACDNPPPQPIIKASDAIKLAKEAAAEQKSPPRRADEGVRGGLITSNAVRFSYPNEVALWPDTPGIAMTQLPARAWQPRTSNPAGQLSTTTASVTLETRVEMGASGSGTLVTFVASWPSRDGGMASHRWQFQVDSTRKASFVGEAGDELPQLIQVVFLGWDERFARS
jgi:hypothetical protein